MTLVVVHRHNQVEVAPTRSKEQGICRKRTGHIQPLFLTAFDCRQNFLFFFASAEQSIFARMWINPTNADTRTFDPRRNQRGMTTFDCPLYQTWFDPVNRIDQPDV